MGSSEFNTICRKLNYSKFFPKNKIISVHEINPEIFSNNIMLEFTPLYNFRDSLYCIGISYYCGNDCGNMELYKLKNNIDTLIIEDQIAVGVM